MDLAPEMLASKPAPATLHRIEDGVPGFPHQDIPGRF
jgi:hypothetical protein